MIAIISCLTNSYGRFGARAAIENVRSAGLEHIELPIHTAGQKPAFGDEPLVTTDSTFQQLQDVDSLLQRHQVQVSSCNVSSGNPLDADVLELTKRKLDLASHFGITKAVGGAGEVPDQSQLAALYDNLRQIGDHAAQNGITYCFETHPGLCQNHRAMQETMSALQHPNLRINFDTGNIYYYNQNIECEIALAKVCHWVAHLHLKDSMGEYQHWYFPALGRGGAVDFVRVLELMRACGFAGPYSIEIEGIEDEGQLALEDYQRRIVDSVVQLKNCGYFD